MDLATGFGRRYCQTTTIYGTCGTYLAAEGCAMDVADWEEKEVGSERERDIANNERRAMVEGR
jgi:hypothetical protein